MSRHTETPFWNAAALQALLQTRCVGRQLILFNHITSTNDFLKRLARRGAATGTVVLANEQSAGRGRLGRRWHSPAGKGLWFSVLLHPQLAPDKIAMISPAIAAVIAETLSQFCAREFHVKWPNDVLVAGKKVCGILCETQIVHDQVQGIIVGIGLNVSQEADDFAPALQARATSLARACGRNFDRQLLLAELLLALENELCVDLQNQLPELKAKWCARCPDIGKRLTIAHVRSEEGTSGATTGIFESITEGGELVLRQPGGKVVVFAAGEITLSERKENL